MHVAVIIPVGPGHATLAQHAAHTVMKAWAYNRGPFKSLSVAMIDDYSGKAGRSASRNNGMTNNPADWHFLLDADDEMTPGALAHVDLTTAATFGAISLGKKKAHGGWILCASKNYYPLTRDMIFKLGPIGTLSMGCFVRGDLGLRFDEALDNGEDFDFYMRLPSFTKVAEALVIIGYRHPSSVGPRASQGNWATACWERIKAHE